MSSHLVSACLGGQNSFWHRGVARRLRNGVGALGGPRKREIRFLSEESIITSRGSLLGASRGTEDAGGAPASSPTGDARFTHACGRRSQFLPKPLFSIYFRLGQSLAIQRGLKLEENDRGIEKRERYVLLETRNYGMALWLGKDDGKGRSPRIQVALSPPHEDDKRCATRSFVSRQMKFAAPFSRTKRTFCCVRWHERLFRTCEEPSTDLSDAGVVEGLRLSSGPLPRRPGSLENALAR